MPLLKTLSLPVVSLLCLSTTGSLRAQDTYFSLATKKTFRQGVQRVHAFRGGSLDLIFRDGLVVFQSGCTDSFFFTPDIVCPLGSNGFTTFTSFGAEPDASPYLSVLSITPATLVEPTLPDSPHLFGAPASKLPRPLYGFTDYGLGVFYDLFNSDSIREYRVAGYRYSRPYEAGESARMKEETVPGSYFFRFPKLGNPTVPVNLSVTVRNLPDGLDRVNSQFTGLNFDTSLGFDADGFLLVPFNKPSTFRWSGFGANLINANTDRLYFSIRFLTDPADSLSETIADNPETGFVAPSVFPAFVTGRNPRIALQNPFVTSFSIPPIFQIGSTGVVELELVRNLANSGVVFDTSSRKYQIPIRFASSYSGYAASSFGSSSRKVGIDEDFDGDGFDNLTEWVLNSRAQDANSRPANQRLAFDPGLVDNFFIPPFVIRPAYFGFKVGNSVGYTPNIRKILQRSVSVAPARDVWVDMVSDANWDLIVTDETVELLSKTVSVAAPNRPSVPNQPPGTAGHKFRFRVELLPAP